MIEMKNGATGENEKTFAEKHPRWNLFFGFIMLFGLMAIAVIAVDKLINVFGRWISKLVLWVSAIATTASQLDAVVVVALITGGVSITGIILSSIVAKSLEYKRARREYLTQKREEPYSKFIEMIYKTQQGSKQGYSYPKEEMTADIISFSKQITLWGSPRVVNKWVKFRELSLSGNPGIDNVLLTEEIMNAMRKDLGLKRVKKGNLLALFINDIKKEMKANNKNRQKGK